MKLSELIKKNNKTVKNAETKINQHKRIVEMQLNIAKKKEQVISRIKSSRNKLARIEQKEKELQQIGLPVNNQIALSVLHDYQSAKPKDMLANLIKSQIEKMEMDVKKFEKLNILTDENKGIIKQYYAIKVVPYIQLATIELFLFNRGLLKKEDITTTFNKDVINKLNELTGNSFTLVFDESQNSFDVIDTVQVKQLEQQIEESKIKLPNLAEMKASELQKFAQGFTEKYDEYKLPEKKTKKELVNSIIEFSESYVGE